MPILKNYSLYTNKLRHKFRNAGIEKEAFISAMNSAISHGRFVNPSQLENELIVYFSNKGVQISTRQISELFQHFQLNPESKVDLPQVADCLFSENYADFIERHNRNPRLTGNLNDVIIENENETSIEDQKEIDGSLLPIIKKFEAKTLLKNRGYFESFKAVDIDKDGYISKQDFRSFMKQKEYVTEKEIDQLFDFFSKKNDNAIPFAGFIEKLQTCQPYHSLIENNRNSNVMGLAQFDPKLHIGRMNKYRESMEKERNKFRISCPNDNCKIISLLRQGQV